MYTTNINQKVTQVNLLADERSIENLKLGIMAFETLEEDTLFPSELKPGFYLICRQDTAECKTDNYHVSLNKLIEKKYMNKIPVHSVYADSLTTGFVLHYDNNSEPIILTTAALNVILKREAPVLN